MTSQESKNTEKISFIIAFVGVIIALEPISDGLKSIGIDLSIDVDFGFAEYNILLLFYITFGLLLLSLYVYALDYVRYGFTIFDHITMLKHLQPIANTFYFFAVISPIAYLTIIATVKIYKMVPVLNADGLALVNFIVGLIMVLIGFYITGVIFLASWRQINESNQAKEEHLDESAFNSMNEARQLVDKRLWNLSIIEVYRSLELSINKKLLELGIDARKIPFHRSIGILSTQGVLTADEADKLNYVRGLRNESVHSSIKFSEDEALDAIKIINDILPKLETVTTRGLAFENEIFEALRGENGLFPGDHMFREKPDQGCDIKVEGLNYKYLIEIKSKGRARIINSALKQMKRIPQDGAVRYIIIVPKTEDAIDLKDADAKVLYYDSEKHEFKNLDEIHNWVHEN